MAPPFVEFRLTMTWIVFSVLTAATVAALALPFFRSRRTVSGADTVVYLAQLKEVDREESLGLVEARDAELARIEIKRRLAASAGPAADAEDAPMTRSDRITLAAVAGLVAALHVMTRALVMWLQRRHRFAHWVCKALARIAKVSLKQTKYQQFRF